MLETYTTENDSLSQVVATVPVIFPGFEGNVRQIAYPSSVTLFIILGFAIFAVIKYNFGKNLQETFQSFFNYRQAWRMFEERKESDRQNAVVSNLLFFIVVGIFASLTMSFMGINLIFNSFSISILFFSVSASLFYALKSVTWHALGVIFLVQPISQMYVHSMFLYNRIAGLVVFPLVAIIPYISEIIVPFIIPTVFVVFALSYIFRLYRIFQIIYAQKVSILHFILYLCALEILPLLLIVKVCKTLSENMML